MKNRGHVVDQFVRPVSATDKLKLSGAMSNGLENLLLLLLQMVVFARVSEGSNDGLLQYLNNQSQMTT